MQNHRWKKFGCIAAFTLILAWGCTRPPAPAVSQKVFDYAQHVGVASVRPDGMSCLAIHNASISPETKVTLVNPPDATQPSEQGAMREARIVIRLSEKCDDHIGAGDGEEPSAYRIRIVGNSEPVNSTFIAIVDPAGPITFGAGTIDADIDGDGTKESFRTCASSEGLHYQIWSGEALKGQPRWHWYIYAGYDTEPTCSDKEYFGPKTN